jgi:SP family arabinose:H+ symporter-like MFS transporter
MAANWRYTLRVTLCVALGGFLMGFDASVISGVVGFIQPQFDLSSIEVGWAVASLALTSTLAMSLAGPLSDRFGRRPILIGAAIVFLVSALGSALAPDYITLVLARMLGGFGVGAALIIAPMYIAEIAPPANRGRMVSLNQLNIVLGISVAFFSNYMILQWLGADNPEVWRWMLGVEALPALVYLVCLAFVPESPRWLMMHDRAAEALVVMTRATDAATAKIDMAAINASLAPAGDSPQPTLKALMQPSLRLVLMIGATVAILQQITGINAVFFYAPMIFEQSGIGTDAAFLQAVLVGLVNLVFTLVAIYLIDRLGRRPLLLGGVSGIAVFMFLIAYGFSQATYTVTSDAIEQLPDGVNKTALYTLVDQRFDSDTGLKQALQAVPGLDAQAVEAALLKTTININPNLILVGILGFVASFAVSVGPVMWVLFSELFPNHIRGVAISLVGLLNSGVSFMVQLIFPWELATLGSAMTFALYGIFALLGLIMVWRLLPETKGRSLEELETLLVRA